MTADSKSKFNASAGSITRVAIYVGLNQGQRCQEIDFQLSALREYCAKQRWEIAGEYVGREAGHSRHPHFQEMLADARLRRFDLALFWSLDCFPREGFSATLNRLADLTAARVSWRSFTEQFFDSGGPLGAAVSSILTKSACLTKNASPDRPHLKLPGNAPRGRPRLMVDEARVRQLHDAGMSLRVIGKELGISSTTAYRLSRPKA